MLMGAGSIFMVIISPPLIAISILCSCKKQLKILPSVEKKISTKNAETTATTTSSSRSDKKLSAIPLNNFTTSSSNYEKCTTNNKKLPIGTVINEISEKHEIIMIKQKKPEMQIQKRIPELPDKRLSENQTARKNDSNYKRSKEKAIIQDDLLASQLERSITSQLERSITSQLERSSFTNQNDQLLKKNDLQDTRNEKSNFLLHEEQMQQLIVNDGNENESEFSALMVDDIIVFPSQLKWKLMNTVQRVKLKNPTENRFAIKVKCTNNDLYRVKPIFTFVEPKSFVIFDVYRHDGIATVDHILFLTTSAEKTDDDPCKLFADSVIIKR